LLAPLFDRMTMHIIVQWFTTLEALDLLNIVISRLPSDAWTIPLALESDWSCCGYEGPYWTQTPPGLLSLRARYEMPPFGYTARLLGRLCAVPTRWRVTRAVRRVLR
ncbi:hypothetical protein BD414DRAFT_378902, partial [Trametes punicea]